MASTAVKKGAWFSGVVWAADEDRAVVRRRRQRPRLRRRANRRWPVPRGFGQDAQLHHGGQQVRRDGLRSGPRPSRRSARRRSRAPVRPDRCGSDGSASASRRGSAAHRRPAACGAAGARVGRAARVEPTAAMASSTVMSPTMTTSIGPEARPAVRPAFSCVVGPAGDVGGRREGLTRVAGRPAGRRLDGEGAARRGHLLSQDLREEGLDLFERSGTQARIGQIGGQDLHLELQILGPGGAVRADRRRRRPRSSRR